MKRFALLVSLSVLLSHIVWSQTNIPGNAINSSKHYRESGVGNATGRAGAASLTARALLGKDGESTVEVTTGTLDSSTTPPGSLARVQFKPLNAAGNPLYTQNFTPSSTDGYYSFTSPSLHRAEQIQLQGSITGIDKNRTDVVTLVETTKFRPDLSVQSLSSPSTAIINHPINISANIVELNGDAPATTTCVLAIDGSNVDQVPNVYVDAGGSVSCAFVHAFTTTGSHTIQVIAASVVPADWDTGNNSDSSTITIDNPNMAQHAFAVFKDKNRNGTSTYSAEDWYLGIVQDNYSGTSGGPVRNQGSASGFYSSGCTGSTNAAPFRFPVNVVYAETMDGTSVYSLVDNGINGFSGLIFTTGTLCNSTVASYTFQYGSDYVSDHWLYLTSSQYNDSATNPIFSWQDVESRRYAGDVTYFSYGYECYYWYAGGCNNPPANYYTWNSSSQSGSGTIVPVGSTWVPSVTVQDAVGNTFSGSISVPLESFTDTVTQPNTCASFGPDASGYSYLNCFSFSYTEIDSGGSASN